MPSIAPSDSIPPSGTIHPDNSELGHIIENPANPESGISGLTVDPIPPTESRKHEIPSWQSVLNPMTFNAMEFLMKSMWSVMLHVEKFFDKFFEITNEGDVGPSILRAREPSSQRLREEVFEWVTWIETVKDANVSPEENTGRRSPTGTARSTSQRTTFFAYSLVRTMPKNRGKVFVEENYVKGATFARDQSGDDAVVVM
ncbi:hypothetical protein QQS21_008227 [Conoideocrella luteorostrata]|uniref:Uncharacterized protein n=1 Tax=Conoideocrella luteorostrata TaxID=1105319 RepID=A0AAJ0CLM3_9HYPO|nr:hypothetical protein QQS21_008227 [Conoideocrella luteorostrata]